MESLSRSTVLRTDDVSPRDRSSFWAGVVCGVHWDASFDPIDEEPYFGVIETHQRGAFRVSRFEAAPAVLKRSSRELSRGSSLDEVIALVVLGGSFELTHYGRTGTISAGEALLVDGGEPYELKQNSAIRVLSVKGPRRVFEASSPVVAERYGVPIPVSRGLGRVASNALITLIDEFEGLDDTAAHQSVLNLLEILLLAMSGSPVQPQDSETVRRALGHQAYSYVRVHSGEQAITLLSAAAELGVSPRTLQNVFADGGTTFSETLREARLELARKLLENPASPRTTITAIAYRSGFNSHSGFTRAFTRRFGASPLNYRESSRLPSET